MKNLKKSWIALLLCLIATVFGVCFVGCNKEVEPVAITVSQAYDGETLLQYMEDMQKDGELSFTVSDGMVTGINGTSQTTNTYWMLYTSDTENANTAWGTYEYDGQTLGSAIYGAESLTVKNGCVYVWVFTTF
ncbi:MAG: DUF4430 domain-containing protein [Candidatus Coproplasma sp.]